MDGGVIAVLVICVFHLLLFIGVLVAAVILVPGWVDDTTDDVSNDVNDNVNAST